MQFDKYSTRGPDYHYREIDKGSLRSYNASVDARFRKLVTSVKKVAGTNPLKLLDVGCGDGVALSLIGRALPALELHGIDEVESALAIARKKLPKADIAQASAYTLPYPDATFDIVISSDVIEHLEEPGRMLGEIKRVSKSGGTIIIGTPIRRTKKPIDPQHVQEFFIEDFLDLVNQFFVNTELRESHNLISTLLYNAPTKSFLNFRYAINLLAIATGFNPFISERSRASQMFAYMYVLCRK